MFKTNGGVLESEYNSGFNAWFQAPTAVQMRFSLLWNVKQCRLVVSDLTGQPVGPIVKGQAASEECQENQSLATPFPCNWVPSAKCSRHFYWTAWPWKLGPIGCPATSLTNYQYTLYDIPEKQRAKLYYTYSAMLSDQSAITFAPTNFVPS